MDKSDFSSSKVSNSGISLRQHIAVQQLVLTGSISAAAAAAGVTTKTIHTWQKQPSFQEALRFAELQALEEYLRGVTSLSSLTIEALRSGLLHENISVRLRAAAMALDAMLRLRETIGFESRLIALERAAHERP